MNGAEAYWEQPEDQQQEGERKQPPAQSALVPQSVKSKKQKQKQLRWLKRYWWVLIPTAFLGIGSALLMAIWLSPPRAKQQPIAKPTPELPLLRAQDTAQATPAQIYGEQRTMLFNPDPNHLGMFHRVIQGEARRLDVAVRKLLIDPKSPCSQRPNDFEHCLNILEFEIETQLLASTKRDDLANPTIYQQRAALLTKYAALQQVRAGAIGRTSDMTHAFVQMSRNWRDARLVSEDILTDSVARQQEQSNEP